MAASLQRLSKCAQPSRCLSAHTSLQRPIQIGDRLPPKIVYSETPNTAINIAELFKGKKGILFSVPGAFTPGCTHSHIPEYLHNMEHFKEEGYNLVACLAVNDPFVLSAWGKDIHAEGKIKMLADMKCDFTKAIGMDLDCSPLLGNIRSKRYSMVIEDSVVTQLTLEPDETGLACLLCIRNMKSDYVTPSPKHKHFKFTEKLERMVKK